MSDSLQSQRMDTRISPASVISESITRLRIHEEVQKIGGLAIHGESSFNASKSEPFFEDHQLWIGTDTVVPLDQFNELYIEYPSATSSRK